MHAMNAPLNAPLNAAAAAKPYREVRSLGYCNTATRSDRSTTLWYFLSSAVRLRLQVEGLALAGVAPPNAPPACSPEGSTRVQAALRRFDWEQVYGV